MYTCHLANRRRYPNGLSPGGLCRHYSCRQRTWMGRAHDSSRASSSADERDPSASDEDAENSSSSENASDADIGSIPEGFGVMSLDVCARHDAPYMVSSLCCLHASRNFAAARRWRPLLRPIWRPVSHIRRTSRCVQLIFELVDKKQRVERSTNGSGASPLKSQSRPLRSPLRSPSRTPDLPLCVQGPRLCHSKRCPCPSHRVEP